MTHNRIILIFIFSIFVLADISGTKKLDSLLVVLDKVLDLQDEYDKQKEQRITDLKIELGKRMSNERMHETYFQLYKEHEAYVFDSAMHYVNIHLNISLSKNDSIWINECKMQLARMHSTFAQFTEAIDLLNSIDKKELTNQQLGAYYNSYAEVYIYWGEYTNNGDIRKFVALKDTYQDSALMVLPQNTYDYDINNGRKCIELKEFDEAERILIPYLSTIETDSRDYAILTSIIAYLYELKGDEDLQKEYLAMSAIADIKASVKENISLRTLAVHLLNDGEVNRSNRYIKKSLEDANFYNARLRNIQIAKILPIIDKAYQIEREKYQKNLQRAIVVIGILSLFLVGLVFYLIRQMNKLSKTRKEVIAANKELKKMNIYLSENIHIKEEYIGRFLNQCSIYIDKLETYRKALNKKASSGKIDDLFQMLKSSQIIEDELKEFYINFDSTFLNLFPDFVEQFNKLLPEEDKVMPKHEGCLTIELRIFALIRLGITDSSKIANFLRYSITTIYNYRSKYRNKSLVSRGTFEETIMKISSFKLQ